MSRVVAIAPTLSDAVQSVGGLLARHAAHGHEVVVVAVFDDSNHGAGSEQAAAERLGLAGVVRVGMHADSVDAETAVGAALAVGLNRLEPGLVLSPIGLTGHHDVRIINEALDALDVPRVRWLDLPYALYRTPGAPLGAGEVVAVPIGAHLDAKLEACAALGETAGAALREHANSEGVRLGVGEPVEILLARTASAPSD